MQIFTARDRVRSTSSLAAPSSNIPPAASSGWRIPAFATSSRAWAKIGRATCGLATQAAGLLRVARRGFVTFREFDGQDRRSAAVFEDRAGAAHCRQSGLASQPLRRRAFPDRARKHPCFGATRGVAREPEGDRGSSRRLVVREWRRADPILRHSTCRRPCHGGSHDLHHGGRTRSRQRQPAVRGFTGRHLDRRLHSGSRGPDPLGSRLRPLSDLLGRRRPAGIQRGQQLLRRPAGRRVHHASRWWHRAL